MFRTLIGATALAAALTAAPALAETLRFAVTDLEGMEALQQEFGAFEKALETATATTSNCSPSPRAPRRSRRSIRARSI